MCVTQWSLTKCLFIPLYTNLLNCVHCMLKTCWRANVIYMLKCSRSNMPCVLTCSLANMSCVVTIHVLTCLAWLRAYVLWVLTCSRANVLCVFTCSRANVPCFLTFFTCQHALRAYVRRYLRSLRAHVLTCQHALSLLPHTTCVTMWSPANMFCLLTK